MILLIYNSAKFDRIHHDCIICQTTRLGKISSVLPLCCVQGRGQRGGEVEKRGLAA